MSAKKYIVRLALAGEIIIFGAVYFTSPSGFKALLSLKEDNKQLEGYIISIQDDITRLAHEIVEWDTYPWYKEKIAREELQMAYPGEEVFLLD